MMPSDASSTKKSFIMSVSSYVEIMSLSVESVEKKELQTSSICESQRQDWPICS